VDHHSVSIVVLGERAGGGSWGATGWAEDRIADGRRARRERCGVKGCSIGEAAGRVGRDGGDGRQGERVPAMKGKTGESIKTVNRK